MRRGQYLSSLLLAAGLVSPALNTACAEHHYYRAYDVDHGDYHQWNDQENVYYHQWVVENHRDDRDFRKLNKDDQKKYWDWRHNHHD